MFVDNHPNISFRNYAYPTAMAVLFAAAVWLLAPRSLPSPIYLDNAYMLVDGKSLAGNFMPVGYPALLAPAIALMGETWGVLILQSGFYMIAVLLAWTILRWSGIGAVTAGAAVLVVALHPHMLLNINRITENAVTAPLFLAMAMSVWFPGRITGPWRQAGLGIALGLLLIVRPNIFSAVPVYLAYLWFVGDPRRTVSVSIIGLVTYVLISYLATGEPFFWPRNGPYNFFAGFNSLTEHGLWTWLHAEPSIPEGLRRLGQFQSEHQRIPGELYTRLALDFIFENPGEAVKLIFLKAITFLRPDLRSGGELPMLILRSLLALPLPLWFGVMLYQKFRHDGGRSVGTLLILAAYCAPYFIINADPRYRLPADLLVLLHLATMAAAWLQQRAEARNNANSDD